MKICFRFLDIHSSLFENLTNPECRNFETITNANKLVGVTTGELKNAIATIPKVTALCTRTTALTNQANSLLTGLGGISLGGLLPVGLELKIPSLPGQLTTFACP